MFPADKGALADAKPVYESLDGWEEDISGCSSYKDLPEAAQNYISFIEDFLECPVKYISVGQRRDQIIHI